MNIIFKDKNVVAVIKPAGMPSQPDPTGDMDAMTLASDMLKNMGEQDALWLVHRLDRVVGGVLVFARNKAAAAELSARVADKSAKKEYLAVVEGECQGGILTDFLFKDAKRSKAFVVDRKRAGVKEASLECEPLSSVSTDRGVKSLVRVRLFTGRFHQIRAQLSSRGNSIVGDGKYGSHDNRCAPALFSTKLSFECCAKSYDIKALPELSEYPWALFSTELFGDLYD